MEKKLMITGDTKIVIDTVGPPPKTANWQRLTPIEREALADFLKAEGLSQDDVIPPNRKPGGAFQATSWHEAELHDFITVESAKTGQSNSSYLRMVLASHKKRVEKRRARKRLSDKELSAHIMKKWHGVFVELAKGPPIDVDDVDKLVEWARVARAKIETLEAERNEPARSA